MKKHAENSKLAAEVNSATYDESNEVSNTQLSQLIKYPFAVLIGFIVILVGSVVVPGLLLPLLYGPFPTDGNVPFIRLVSDFGISFLFTVLGGALAAALSPSHRVLTAIFAGLAYFALSTHWYIGYNLSDMEWGKPLLMLIKVPIAAFLGAYIVIILRPVINSPSSAK